MSAAVVAIVLFVFFLIGIGTGLLLVIAASARKAYKAVPRDQPVAPPPAHMAILARR
jgi:hypothetical protein